MSTSTHEEALGFVGMGWRKLMMWIFIVTDGLLFAGFLASYGLARTGSASWPDQQEVFHLWFISLMTFTLISSSATMATAVAAARGDDWRVAKTMLLATALGGLAFLGMQAIEWSTLIRDGVTLSTNPWNVPAFGSYFYTITGFHGTHVLIGVGILSNVLYRASAGKTTAEGVELAGLYWHFVDLVWVFIFTLFYLV